MTEVRGRLVHFEKMVSSGNYVVDYRGYEIAYQSPPIFRDRWVANLGSTSLHLINRLGRGNIILEDITLEGDIAIDWGR